MKSVFIISLLLVHSLTAQKIQIKKDKVLLDNKEIALIQNPYRDHYEYYSLSNEKIFEVHLKGVDLANEEFIYYLDLKSAEGKITQIPYEVLVTSLKPDRIITHQLAVKYQLFDSRGIDREKIEAFFDVPRESLADKYALKKSNSFVDAEGKQQRLQNIKDTYNPRLAQDGEILFNNGNYPAKVAGYIKAYDCDQFSYNPCLEVWDLDNIKVAAVFPGNHGTRSYLVKTYDGNQFTLDVNRIFTSSDYIFVTELVSHLISEGYVLEHQAFYKHLQQQNTKLERQ